MLNRIRTKIIATLGPALDTTEALAELVKAGVNLLRFNFSHADHAKWRERVAMIRALKLAYDRPIAIVADLQGPKIRIGAFSEGYVDLNKGDTLVLDLEAHPSSGSAQGVFVSYPDLIKDIRVDDELLLDDGRISLIVERIAGSQVVCQTKCGGRLHNNKGLNRKGGGLSAKALTEQDKLDLKAAADEQVDYVAVSFAHDADDIRAAKALIQQMGSRAKVIVKIERSEALGHLDEMIEASDAVMVARGDLGVEIGFAQLPAAQKRIISRSRELNKPVIVATQMMESMIESSIPTRAEVVDVAGAVLDNADALMLSAETAVGAHPDRVVQSMVDVCRAAEADERSFISTHRTGQSFEQVDESVAMASMYVANHFNIKAIICLTESGQTPLWMSRIRSAIPIFAFTPDQSSLRQMALLRGVYPILLSHMQTLSQAQIDEHCMTCLRDREVVNAGDFVIITRGEAVGIAGHTNTMKIVRVTE